MTVIVNARFLSQPLSGVQRYASGLVGALDKMLFENAALARALGPVVALHPAIQCADPGWRAIRRRVLRGGTGHFWEQIALARAARDAVLVSLGNSGPLAHGRQVVAFHDAHIWTEPGAYSCAYRAAHRWLRPRLARRAAAPVTVSRYSAQALARHLDISAERFTIIANSADHILDVAPDTEILQRSGLRFGGYLLSVGNQSPNKNLGRLVAAHRSAGPSVPPLAIAGSSPPGLVPAPTGPAARVLRLGRVSDSGLRALYEGAAGFVFPSLSEGFGIPPLEAMSLGIPVLAARRAALPEVLGTAPLWFDPFSTADIARALRAFADLGPAARSRMATEGRARAAQYGWDRSAARLASLLLQQLQQPAGESKHETVRPISARSVASDISRP